MMQRDERILLPENARAALAWLSERIVGATLVEFIQKLPPEHAEEVHSAAQELKRLKNDVERHEKTARSIEAWSWIAGIAGVATVNTLLSGRIAPALMLATAGATIAAIWWITSRMVVPRVDALAVKANTERSRINECVFERFGVVYNEAEGRVHSIVRLATRYRKIQQDLKVNNAVYDEIQRGLSLARGAGIDPSLFRHQTYLLSPVLGGLPTEELLEHPDCARLFQEMSKQGLRDHSVEAVLLRRTDADLPITPRTLEFAKARMHPASRGSR